MRGNEGGPGLSVEDNKSKKKSQKGGSRRGADIRAEFKCDSCRGGIILKDPAMEILRLIQCKHKKGIQDDALRIYLMKTPNLGF